MRLLLVHFLTIIFWGQSVSDFVPTAQSEKHKCLFGILYLIIFIYESNTHYILDCQIRLK